MRGQLVDAGRVIAIVGARAARTEDLEAAHALGRTLAAQGALVVSGGALGVDAAAHAGALHGSSPGQAATMAVLGSGLNVAYPEQNQPLFQDIHARGGALVSQFEPDAPPRNWHFVRRNATIAGMADAVVVIGADTRSGALHTARAARALGRLVGARPGSAGCEALIASGAALIRDIEDLEAALAGRPARPDITLPDGQSPAGQVLASLHQAEARDADDIALATGLMVREVNRALTRLEIDGLAIPVPGRSYIRSALAQELLVR